MQKRKKNLFFLTVIKSNEFKSQIIDVMGGGETEAERMQ